MECAEKKIGDFIEKNYGFKPEEIKIIPKGVINSNYFLNSNAGKYVFKVYNFKNKDEVGFEVEVLEYLKDKDFPSPRLMHSSGNNLILEFDGKPCVMSGFIEGKPLEKITPAVLNAIGGLEGCLHNILSDFKPSVSKSAWEPEDLMNLIKLNREKLMASAFLDADEWLDFAESEIGHYKFSGDLPVGITHQDIKPENIIVKGDSIAGIIDFDNSYIGALLHDITTTIIWSCFTDGHLDTELLNTYLMGYNKERKITVSERECLMDAIKFRLAREVFIGPFVTMHQPEFSKQRADYFTRLYKELVK